MNLPTVSIDVDLSRYPEVREAFREKERELEAESQAEIVAAERKGDDLMAAMGEINVELQDARRMLTRPQPSPAEALIYIERALALAANSR